MKKAFVVLIILILILIVGGAVYLKAGKNNQERVEQEALRISDTVAKLYRGNNYIEVLEQMDNPDIDPIVYEQLHDIDTSLKELNNIKFNLTDHIGEIIDWEEDFSDDVESSPSVGDPENIEEDFIGELPVEYIDSEDERIFYEGEKAFIYVRDLDFRNSDKDIVTYKNQNFLIYRNDVPETYDMMIKNPDNHLQYHAHKEGETQGKKYIDIMYTSLKSSNKTIIVRVYYKKGKITGIGVN